MQPSLKRIVLTDSVSFLAFVAPVVSLAFVLYLTFVGDIPALGRREAISSDDASFFVKLGLAAIAVGIPLLVWRVRLITGLIRDGAQVQGDVTEAGFRRDRGRLEYRYTHNGQTFVTRNSVMKNKRTEAIAVGDSVAVVYDAANPQKAFLRDIYTD